mgnify:CR=1 FL=1
MSIVTNQQENEIIQSYIRQYDVIVDLLEIEGLASFQESLCVMEYVVGDE